MASIVTSWRHYDTEKEADLLCWFQSIHNNGLKFRERQILDQLKEFYEQLK